MKIPKSDEIPPRFRLLRGIRTYKEAAQKAGFTAGDWHNWEKGKHLPTTASARKIGAAYEVDPEWILTGKGRGPQSPHSVIPVETGIHWTNLDARLRGHDEGKIGEAAELYKMVDEQGRRIIKYEAIRLDRNLLRPFLPMVVLMWVSNQMLRVDARLSVRLMEVVSERCAFDDENVWEIGK